MDDMQAMTLLHRLGTQSLGAQGLEPVLADICDAAIALAGMTGRAVAHGVLSHASGTFP